MPTSKTSNVPQINCYSLICGANTVDTLISALARRIHGIDVFSLDATPVYAKLYDKATAPASTDTPVHRTAVPANATAALGSGSNKDGWAGAIGLTHGLGIRITTGIADTDTGALTANEVLVNVYWSR